MQFALIRKIAGTLCLILTFGVGAETLEVLAPDLPSSSEPGGKGRDAETVSAILEECGFKVTFNVLPFGRHLRNFTDTRQGDAVMTVPRGREVDGFASRTYIWYQNGAIVLESNPRKPYRIEHLRGTRAVTFAGGAKILNLESVADSFSDFMELSNQRLYASMLYLGRVDVVLADGLIFAETSKRLRQDPVFAKRVQADAPVMFIPIFNPSPYTMVFRQSSHREQFDRCLLELEGDGVLRAINKRYVEEYRQIVGRGYLGY